MISYLSFRCFPKFLVVLEAYLFLSDPIFRSQLLVNMYCYCSKCVKKPFKSAKTIKDHLQKDYGLYSDPSLHHKPEMTAYLEKCIQKTEMSLDYQFTKAEPKDII